MLLKVNIRSRSRVLSPRNNFRNDTYFVSDSYLATGEGTTEKIFRVPDRNRTQDLCNDEPTTSILTRNPEKLSQATITYVINGPIYA